MSIQFKQSLILGVCLISSSWSFAAVKEYQLVIDESPVNLTGKSLKRISVNGQFPAPLLEFEEGDDAVIRVKNNLKKTGFIDPLAWFAFARANGWCARF